MYTDKTNEELTEIILDLKTKNDELTIDAQDYASSIEIALENSMDRVELEELAEKALNHGYSKGWHESQIQGKGTPILGRFKTWLNYKMMEQL